MTKLILTRHGQSTWNAENRFTGWVDVDLSDKGIKEAEKSGQIINVGSIAGKESYPKGNVYCASKAAVEKFTEGLRLDLNPFGIRVSAVHPGLVATNFSNVRFKGDKERAKKVYEGFTPLSANDVADCICYMIEAPKHVNIADLTILPTDQASAYVLNKSD